MIERRQDILFPSPNTLGLTLEAFYNSRSSEQGSLGQGWRHTYECLLYPDYPFGTETYLKIVDGDGRAAYFQEASPGVYEGAFHELSHVASGPEGYVWSRLDGSRYGFTLSGRLIWIDDEKDNRLLIAYDAQDRLESVTDIATGRTITFHYNGINLLDHVSGPVTSAVESGTWVMYGYDAVWADGLWGRGALQ